MIEGTQLVEKWYPTQILPYMEEDEAEKFWNDHDLEINDWFGLTNKLLQELFCREILTPLEQTDVFYSLKVFFFIIEYSNFILLKNFRLII